MVARFLDYVEIKTKITSIFAFLMSIVYLFYIEEPINWKLTLIFFTSMFLFDLTTTAINNYIDTKTNHQNLEFKRNIALMIIIILLGISTASGLYLAYLTDVVILIIGAICFVCGILYTFGPVPISRQPLGELLSGLFYGFFIPFIIFYINMPAGAILSMNLSFTTININLNILPIINIILLSVIPICATANIMLANNICDLERDITQKRYTLPYYLGNTALSLFASIYYLIYIDIVILVLLKVVSPVCLIALLTIFFTQKNINKFLAIQEKDKTFNTAIKNYVIIMGSITLMIFISGLIS